MFEESYVIQVFNDFLDLLHRFYKLYQRNFVRKQITPLEEEASAYPTLRKADVLDNEMDDALGGLDLDGEFRRSTH